MSNHVQCCSVGLKSAAWGVRSQDLNLKELAGEHHKPWINQKWDFLLYIFGSISYGLIGYNAGNITRGDGRMTARLKVLLDKPRGIAWPSSARGVNTKLTQRGLVT